MLDYSLLLEVVLVGLVLSADSFSAALAMGLRKHDKQDVLKFSFTSGFAEGFVAFVGAISGATIVSKFDFIDHWISFVLLGAVALHMFYEGYEGLKGHEEQEGDSKQFHGMIKILLVSFATSLDALAVGVGLGTTGKPLAPFVLSISLWAFFSTIAGMSLARKASDKLGSIFNFIGGFILLGLAIKFLYEGL